MSRTIRLTRIHALNWYGYKDSIAVEGNLLLAGVTGSGKSILMDLIQFVLIGDLRLVRFNQSATGDRSDRSLKGYCLGDTKEEENGVIQYMRQSAITYVALEFTWPDGKRAETWGLRVEFTSAAEANSKPVPFFVPAALERSDFLDSEKRPLDFSAFKACVEKSGGRAYSEGIESYLRDMAQSSHLNFDRGVLRSLLPSAMSFTFLKSFNEFARQFILPSDKLDINDVTASYRTFLAYERELSLLNDQFARLQSISTAFERLTHLRRDRALARYLEAELNKEHAEDLLRDGEQKLETLRKDCASEENRSKELEQAIPQLASRIEGLKATINETPDGRLYNELKSRTQSLAQQISQLSSIGSTLGQALASRLRNARAFVREVRAVPLELDPLSIENLERAIHAVEAGGLAKAGETLTALRASAQRALAEAQRSAAPSQRRLLELRQQLGQLREQEGNLKIGKLPFPTRLLDSLNNALLASSSELPARHLRALCEVTDERWRPAIEVAFGRKFAVVVAARDYEQAEKIYHGLNAVELGNEVGRESLINPSKALKLKKPVRPGSLAEKLETNDSVAEALVSHLFGDLICVDSLGALRALPPDQSGILPDGFMSRGAFVERPRFYDGNPFVGEKGLEQQLAWKRKQIEDLEVEERQRAPLERTIRALAEQWEDHFDLSPSLYTDLARAQELPHLKAEMENVITRLNTIDRAKFDQAAQEINKLEADLKALQTEQRELDKSENRTAFKNLSIVVQRLGEELNKLAGKFETIRNEKDISPWLAEMSAMRGQTLASFPAKDAAASHLNNLFHKCDREEGAAWEEVKSKRTQLAILHPRFSDISAEAESNKPYDENLAKLSASEIPSYTAKAAREAKNWEQLFRSQILQKLRNALNEVENLITLLNAALKKRPIGSNTYGLRHWRNPDYQLYHDLLQVSAAAREDDLFFASVEPRLRDAINNFLKALTEAPDGAEAARLLDYRHYYEYDMEVMESDGRKTSVDRHSGKFSGGENQSPYFIAILASYLRAYRRYSSRRPEPSLGLVPIDEAFSKLSGERIKDCITALKAFDLQGVFSMSTGNIPYAFEHCDWLVVVSKQERRVGRRTETRNVPVSLARDSEDAQRLMGS